MILTAEHNIFDRNKVSDDFIFKSLIQSIISHDNFEIEMINNPNYKFAFKKVCSQGNHKGFSKKEESESWFYDKARQNHYNQVNTFIVELNKL